jgi:hypothetical protein
MYVVMETKIHRSNEQARGALKVVDSLQRVVLAALREVHASVVIPKPGDFVFGPVGSSRPRYAVVRQQNGGLTIDYLTNAGLQPVSGDPAFWIDFEILQSALSIDEGMQRHNAKMQKLMEEDLDYEDLPGCKVTQSIDVEDL